MFESLPDVFLRAWNDLLSRPSGPMSFRFLLQPCMAAIMAIRDGVKDARASRSPYLWTIVHDPARRGPRIKEGLKSTGRIIGLGLAMDVIYQLVAFRSFYPLEAAIVALGLAFVPYLLIRGPTARIARRWRERHPPVHAPRAK